MVTLGAPLLPGPACAEGDGVGVFCGVSTGLGDRVSSGETVIEGDAVAVGVGDPFLRFDFGVVAELGDGVDEVFFCFGETEGDGLGVAFFVGGFRCLCGVGVGVGSKIFLIFVPNDSSAPPGVTIVPKQVAVMRKLRRIILIGANKSMGKL